MKFKFHVGNQAYNIHNGSQQQKVLGSSLYNFVPTTIPLNLEEPWTYSFGNHTAADQHVDGWSEVEISNTWTQVLAKPAISIDAEADQAYTTWGFIFGDDPDPELSPNIPNSSYFIEQLSNNLYAWYPGFHFTLNNGSGDSYVLSQITTPSHLLEWDSTFYDWLQNNMGTGQGLHDISMFEGILTFSYVQSPNSPIQPTSTNYTSANLYFGWFPRDSVNKDDAYSYLVYLGFEVSNRSNYEVYNAYQDSFFGSPEDVCLDLIYHPKLYY